MPDGPGPLPQPLVNRSFALHRFFLGHQLGAHQLEGKGDGGNQHQDGDRSRGVTKIRRAQHAGYADVVAEIRQTDENRADEQDDAAAQELGVRGRPRRNAAAPGAQTFRGLRIPPACLDSCSCRQVGSVLIVSVADECFRGNHGM